MTIPEEKIKVHLIEVYNDNTNAFEWAKIVRKDKIDINTARKKAFAEFYGLCTDYEYVKSDWEENTRYTELTI